MSGVTIKNKGDSKIWGADLNRAVSRSDYGGQKLKGIIFPENPIEGYEGDLIPCNDLDGLDYGIYWCKGKDELDERLDEGYQWVVCNPEDPTKDTDSKGNKYNWRVPIQRAHRVTAVGHLTCSLGEAMWIPIERWLEMEKRRNPSAFAESELERTESPIHNGAEALGLGSYRIRDGKYEEVVRPRR